MRTILFAILVIVWQSSALAQYDRDRIAVAAPNRAWEMQPLQAPLHIVASDGIYDKFVLIRWESSEKASSYKVFRANNSKATSLQEVSNAWQKSTWVCDYSALPNVDYYYTVVASDGKIISPMGTMDKGFLKKSAPMANDERELLAETEVYGAQKQIFLLIGEAILDQLTYRAGATVQLGIHFQNIFDQPTPRSEVRYFLSQDAVLDWNDQLLGSKSLSSIPPNARFALTEAVQLPANLLSGNYNLIIVSSAEGAVLSSKTALTTVKIVNE